MAALLAIGGLTLSAGSALAMGDGRRGDSPHFGGDRDKSDDCARRKHRFGRRHVDCEDNPLREVPELDPTAGSAALFLLTGGALVVLRRRRDGVDV